MFKKINLLKQVNFRLGLVYLSCFVLIIPLFSLIANFDQYVTQNRSLQNEQRLPVIVIADQEKKKKKKSSALAASSTNNSFFKNIFFNSQYENIEFPNEYINQEEIGDFLDDENQLEGSYDNPLLVKPKKFDKVNFWEKARQTKKYDIQDGDSLWTIAKKNNVSLDSIISLNKIKFPHQLPEGKTIEIPAISGVFYQVKKNDTLFKIAKQYNVSTEKIKKYNQLGTFLNVDENIFIPNARLTPFERNMIFGDLFIKPVDGELSSGYGMRFHPVKKRWLFHTGIDISQNNNKGVQVLANGKVTYVGKNGNYGNYIKVRHSHGYESAYAHLNKIYVKKGETVNQGQIIARVGNTGLSTGPHLHLEIIHNGRFINPKRFLKYK